MQYVQIYSIKYLLYCSAAACVCVSKQPWCVRAENNWTVVCAKRSWGEEKQNKRFNILVVFTFWSDESVCIILCRVSFRACFVRISPFAITLAASCYCTPRIVALITQTLQHMDRFVKKKQEKEDFQVSFQHINEQRDHCRKENCGQNEN